MQDRCPPAPAPQEEQRRRFLRRMAGGSLVPWLPAAALAASPDDTARIALPPSQAPSEVPEKPSELGDPPAQRVGFAVVGLGRLSLDEILPAFGQTRHCKAVALVSGDRAKAQKVARHYGIAETAIYDYQGFDRLADNPAVQVVYIVLPNGLHAEYTVRAARAGKHVLCEKPMANSVAECRQMIDACSRAARQLMVAYRSQYEPNNRLLQRWVQEKHLGRLKEFISTNAIHLGDPGQWRLKKALAGGGPLPDVGIYCINGVRFLTGEEPSEVWGDIDRPTGDPRFREVEEAARFVLRFPSGLRATCHTSYGAHRSQFLRLLGSEGWAELDPAYAYQNLRLRGARVVGGQETHLQPSLPEVNEFAKEMDHMAQRVRDNQRPYSSGEDGLQDQRIIEAIYESARSGRWVKLEQPSNPVRGAPPPAEG
ncbi:Gfo/Idh/MocA family protein [Eleftheria terrae]|uniref:Gfo/Idh/MocA family protein n=1 Tax=Eleftheria terrae TaxID=1597781 RepID=UPI00263ABB5E|nr:Gfo/Idh/MocA family oxidoreductase [Eleftheria terrae]WKB52249.1 Gfo/Idh/MocA family oxidoreductase [Eleftheria terrae]